MNTIKSMATFGLLVVLLAQAVLGEFPRLFPTNSPLHICENSSFYQHPLHSPPSFAGQRWESTSVQVTEPEGRVALNILNPSGLAATVTYQTADVTANSIPSSKPGLPEPNNTLSPRTQLIMCLSPRHRAARHVHGRQHHNSWC